jgi:hypothetical protein
MHAKAKTIVRARAAAKPATPVAKARTLAKAREVVPLTEANHLKHSDQTAVVSEGPEFSNSRPRIRHRRRMFIFLKGFDRYAGLNL